MHFHDRDNIERSMMMSDITFYNLVALIETEGYGFKDYMYYVRDPGLGIEGMEEIDDDDKLEEILDNIALQNQKILNVTVVRASSPNAASINTSSNVIEQQIPLEEIGEPKLYQIDEEGVLFSAPDVHVAAASSEAAEVEPMPIQFQTQQSTNLEEQVALGYVQVEENHVYNSEEQMEIEKVMEETRRKEIQMFRKNKKNKEKVTSVKRKAAVMDNEEDSDDDDLEEYGDILARLEEMKRQREDPLLHFEGDTDVEEMYETEEEDALYEPESEEEEEEDEESTLEEESNLEQEHDGQKKKKEKKHRKGPTSRSHASVEELFEEDWIPSSDEDKKPMDLGVEDDDGAEALAYVLPNGRKSRAKKMKKRLWYDENRAHPAEQFVKHLCFIDVYHQFRNALQTMHIAQNRNYEYHRNCSDRVIAQCIDETCPFYIAASQIANEKTFTIRKQYVVHTCPSVSENTKVTAKWVAKFCEEAIRNDPCTTITTIINTAKSKYGVEISTHMAYRAKKAAKNVVLGDQKAQYTRIRDYLQAVLDTNPGSRCIVTTRHLREHPSTNPRFHALFFCLNGCKEGFLNGCRPFIGKSIVFVLSATNV